MILQVRAILLPEKQIVILNQFPFHVIIFTIQV